MFVSVMIGGGMLYIDDKARGVHEGYLVTPITKFELVAGLNVAGAIQAILAGIVITALAPCSRELVFGLLAAESLLYPAAGGGNVGGVQYHDVPDDGARRRSAGAARNLRHPQYAIVFPQRVHLSHQGISYVAAVDRLFDPFTYAVHGFKAILLKDAGFVAIRADLAYLMISGQPS